MHHSFVVWCLCLFACGVQAQIANTGSISWVLFDNVTIPNVTSPTYFMFSMPGIESWTSLMGLYFSDSNLYYTSQLQFNPAAGEYPPSFSSMVTYPSYQNFPPLFSTMQIPAFSTQGGSPWNFLFSAAPPYWGSNFLPLNLSFYIIEMMTIAENQTSPPLTVYKGQQFMYKIVGKSDFQVNDTVKIDTSNCNMNASLAAGHIPSQNELVNANEYFSLSSNGPALFFVVQLKEDCTGMVVTIVRVPPVTVVSIGDSVNLTNWNSNSNLLLQTNEPLASISLVLSDATFDIAPYVIASTGNFNQGNSYSNSPLNPDDQKLPAMNYYSNDLKPHVWYILITGFAGSDITTVTFQTPEVAMLDYTYSVTRTFSILPTDPPPISYLTFKMPQTVSAVCLDTDDSNVQLQEQYPRPPPASQDMDLFYNIGVIPNIMEPTIYTCFVLDQLSIDQGLSLHIRLQATFYQTLNLTQSVNFYDVPRVELVQDQFTQIPSDGFMGAFFMHMAAPKLSSPPPGIPPIAQIAVVDQSDYDYFFSPDITADDWSIPWEPSFLPNWVSSPSPGNGWYIFGEWRNDMPSNLSLKVSLLDEVLVMLPPPELQGLSSVVSFSFFPIAYRQPLALLHVRSASGPVAAIVVSFSQPVDVLAQPRSVPAGLDPRYDAVGTYTYTASNSSYHVIPAVTFENGAMSSDFYLIANTVSTRPVDLNATVTADFVPTRIVTLPITYDPTTIKVAQSAEPQIIQINYQSNLLLLQTRVTISGFRPPDDPWFLYNNTMFGSGGLRSQYDPSSSSNMIGMRLSPFTDSYYAGNTSFDYYFLVLPNTPDVELVITPQPSSYLCNPVLLCGGHGTCPENRISASCSCVEGLSAKYTGARCDDLNGAWSWIIPAAILVLALLVLSIKLIAACKGKSERHKKRSHAVLETTPILGNSIRSDIIIDCLVNVDIALDHVGLVVPKGATLLMDISLCLKAGQFTAIFGPSGAGKSTVMKVLSGKVLPTSGRILLNGSPVANMHDYRSLIGYVPQEDVLNPFLSVRENITHSALVRLPANVPHHEKLRLVDVVIELLGLTPRQHVIVGDLGGRSSLSGGQRKRVSIALELVTCPSILYLDEPTSGLDSKSALSLVSVLKDQVASLGINVIAVLHQPRYEILQACNNIAILAAGCLRYFGSPEIEQLQLVFPPLVELRGPSTSSKLATANVADMLIDHIEEFTWTSRHSSPLEVNAGPSYKRAQPRVQAGFFLQLYLHTKRGLQQLVRDFYSLAVVYGLTLFSCLLVGALYRDSQFVGAPSADVIAKCPSGFQFLCAQDQEDTYMVQGLLISLSLGLTTGSSYLSTFGGTEKLVFMRERTSQNNLAYVLAKFLSVLPNQLIPPLLFMLMFQWLTTPMVPFWRLYVVALGIAEACSGIAHLASILLEDNRALIVTVVSICICNILSGFNPTLTQLKNSMGSVLGSLLPAISYSRWVIEAFYLSIVMVFTRVYDIDITLQVWGYHVSEANFALLMPFVIGAVLRLACIIAIMFKSSPLR